MLGAIFGDIVGSRYEFSDHEINKNFDLLTKRSEFTDDSIMTIAVGDGLMRAGSDAGEEEIKSCIIESMLYFGRIYPNVGYGGSFYYWLRETDPKPYGSFGNGSAMRVSSAGWLYDRLDRVLEVAKWTAEVSHNHAEGIKGAQCTATVVFLARTGFDKEKIREFVVTNFGYDISLSLAELRKRAEHNESCMDSLPKALRSFFEGDNYEDVIRNAVSLGGDTDTLAAIAGSMAEAYYGMPDEFVEEVFKRLGDKELCDVVKHFRELVLKSSIWQRTDGLRKSKQ